jgi:hypothetical protein
MTAALRPVEPTPSVQPHEQPRVPERLDERHYPSGHVWRRNEAHETLVLKIRRGLCFGEDSVRGAARPKLVEAGR